MLPFLLWIMVMVMLLVNYTPTATVVVRPQELIIGKCSGRMSEFQNFNVHERKTAKLNQQTTLGCEEITEPLRRGGGLATAAHDSI